MYWDQQHVDHERHQFHRGSHDKHCYDPQQRGKRILRRVASHRRLQPNDESHGFGDQPLFDLGGLNLQLKLAGGVAGGRFSKFS